MTRPAKFPHNLSRHFPRAAALAIASRNRRAGAAIDHALEGLTEVELRELCIVLASFTSVTALIDSSFVDYEPGDLAEEAPLEPLEIAVRAVATRFGVTPEDIVGESRRQDVVNARHVLSYIGYRLMGISSVRLGKYLSRDHSTVLYASTRVGENATLRRAAVDIAMHAGWTRPTDEDPTETAPREAAS